jgi:dTDP-4-dehydrorhamnose reductase
LNSRLSTQKLERAFGLALPPWQAGVERMLEEVLGPGQHEGGDGR